MKSTQQSTKQIGNYLIESKIGEGSFGSIWSAVSNKNDQSQQCGNKTSVPLVIKTESISNVKQMLILEYQIYKQMEKFQGFPKVLEYGEEETFSFMVMERFQMTLDKYAASRFPKQFLPTDILLQIMEQALSIIEELHKKGYLYRDLKPANLMLKQPYDQLYIIDFGLCKKFISNSRHITMKENKKLVGTPIFCSLHTHNGIQQSRRDDIESWILTCLYFSILLPWQSVANRKQMPKQSQYEAIKKLKEQVNWEALIDDRNKSQSGNSKVPNCMIKIIEHCRKLKFEEQPNYEYLHNLIKSEYKDLTKTSMKQGINWESSINAQNSPLKNAVEPNVVKKIGKINFKAPTKIKQNIRKSDQETETKACENQN